MLVHHKVTPCIFFFFTDTDLYTKIERKRGVKFLVHGGTVVQWLAHCVVQENILPPPQRVIGNSERDGGLKGQNCQRRVKA